MTGHTQFYDLVTIYITIVASNLTASIDNQTEVEVNYDDTLTLNALDFSFDPDVDPSGDQGLTFYWYCRREDESYPDSVPDIIRGDADDFSFDPSELDELSEIPPPVSEADFQGCFLDDSQSADNGRLITGSDGIAEIDTGAMTPMESYVIDVYVTKDNRETSASAVVDVLPAAAPQFDIT